MELYSWTRNSSSHCDLVIFVFHRSYSCRDSCKEIYTMCFLTFWAQTYYIQFLKAMFTCTWDGAERNANKNSVCPFPIEGIPKSKEKSRREEFKKHPCHSFLLSHWIEGLKYRIWHKSSAHCCQHTSQQILRVSYYAAFLATVPDFLRSFHFQS